ncbi:MAG: tetratricopeptide repeat protein [bacterium]|nr:tetratricopeptide repeat protein [bacterium]
MEIYRTILIILILLQSTLAAENYYGYTLPYYDRGIGGTPSGLGGAFVSVADDGNLCFYNPAGVVSVPKRLVTLNYQSSFIGGENLLYLSYIHNINTRHGLGFYFIWSGLGNLQIIDEDQNTLNTYNVSHYQLGISYGNKVLEFLDIGITAKLFYYNIWQYSSNSMDADLGLKMKIVRNLSYGLLFQNFLPLQFKLRNKDEDFPLSLRTGLSYTFNRFLITYEIDKIMIADGFSTTPLNHHFGVRYNIIKNLILNLGTDIRNIYFGLNLKLEQLEFFSGTVRNQNAGNLNFSISYEFRKSQSAEYEMEEFYQGIVAYQNKDYRTSIKYFQKVLEKRNDPTAEFYLRNSEAYLESEEWMSEEEKVLVGMKLELAKKNVSNQEYGKAITTLRDILNINPDNEEANDIMARIKKQVSADVEKFYQQAESLFKQNKFEESLTQCNVALNLDPEHKPAMELKKENETILSETIGKEKLAQQKKDEAETLFNAGLESFKNRNWAEAINNFSKSHQIIPNPEVKEYLEKAKNQLNLAKLDEKNRKEAEVHLKLGSDLLQQKKIKDAIKEFETAVNLNPNNEEAQNLLNNSRAQYEDIINIPLEKGKTALREGKLSEAILNFSEVLKIDPKNEIARQFLDKSKSLVQDTIKLNLKLGTQEYKNGNFPKSLEHYREVLKLEKTNKDAQEGANNALQKLDTLIKEHFNAGVDHYNNKKYQLALNEFETTLKLDSEYLPAREWLDKTKQIYEQNKISITIDDYLQNGTDQFQNKNFIQARNYFSKVLELDKNNAKAREYIQRCDIEIAKMSKQETIAKIITDGLIFYRRRKFNEAIDTWQKAKQSDPENKIIDEYIEFAKKAKDESLNKYYNDGEKFLNEGNLSKAKENFDKALQANPNHSKAKQKLAEVKSAIFEKISLSKKEGLSAFRNGEYDKAIEEFKTVLTFDPENDEVSDYLQTSQKINNYLETSKQLISEKKYAEAIEKINIIQGYNKNDKNAEILKKQALLEGQKMASQWFNDALDYYKNRDIKKAYDRFSSVVQTTKPEDSTHMEAQKMVEKLEKEIDTSVQQSYSSGLAYYEQGDYKKAIDEFNKIVNLKGSYKDTNLLLTKARKIYEKKVAKETELSQQKVQEFLFNGIKLYRDGKLKEAVSEWEKVLRVYPDHQKALKYISRAKYKLSQLEKLE